MHRQALSESEASEDENTELGLKADYGVVYLCRPVNEVLERDGFEGVFFSDDRYNSHFNQIFLQTTRERVNRKIENLRAK